MLQLYKPAMRLLGVLILCVCLSSVYGQDVSDKSIKKNVTPIPNSLQKLLLLEPATFEYDTNSFRNLKLKHGKQYGFLAENVQEVFPSLVSTKHVSYMFGKNAHREQRIHTIDETSLIPVMVSAIQELHNEIEKLKLALKEARK